MREFRIEVSNYTDLPTGLKQGEMFVYGEYLCAMLDPANLIYAKIAKIRPQEDKETREYIFRYAREPLVTLKLNRTDTIRMIQIYPDF